MKLYILLAYLTLPLAAFADTVNVSGNIQTSGGNIFAVSGYVRGETYVRSNGYLSVATTGSFGSYVGISGYLSASGAGYFGDFLRVGGATNTPAGKSVQIGQYAATSSFNSLVVGRYNLDKAKDGSTAPSSTAWTDDDPLFVVGNGTGVTGTDQYRNAFVVYKDGTISMSKAQGDIAMGQFGNP